MFGSGTQGLHSRTFVPPNCEGVSVSRPVSGAIGSGVADPGTGGWTINWYGIVMR